MKKKMSGQYLELAAPHVYYEAPRPQYNKIIYSGDWRVIPNFTCSVVILLNGIEVSIMADAEIFDYILGRGNQCRGWYWWRMRNCLCWRWSPHWDSLLFGGMRIFRIRCSARSFRGSRSRSCSKKSYTQNLKEELNKVKEKFSKTNSELAHTKLKLEVALGLGVGGASEVEIWKRKGN